MQTKALITSCSNKFFPSVINLLGSIKANYPNHPPIYVYDLGLFYTFRKELEMIDGVTVIPMPHFCPHWRACYTWKTYIFAHPLADLNFYIDAGCQVLKPLDEDFEIIEKDDYLLIDVGVTLSDMVPNDYRTIFEVPSTLDAKPGFSAGIIGFKHTQTTEQIFSKVYNAALTGLALGFSENNLWRNKGKDRNIFIRHCSVFRHDQSLINLFFWLAHPDDLPILSNENYHYEYKVNRETGQRIWHCRLQSKKLAYIKIKDLHEISSSNLILLINRLIINAVWQYKNIKTSWKK
jgi:hypothetical protein